MDSPQNVDYGFRELNAIVVASFPLSCGPGAQDEPPIQHASAKESLVVRPLHDEAGKANTNCVEP